MGRAGLKGCQPWSTHKISQLFFVTPDVNNISVNENDEAKQEKTPEITEEVEQRPEEVEVVKPEEPKQEVPKPEVITEPL